MRRTHPDLRAAVPLARGCRWVPALGIVFNLAMMLALGWHNWLRLFVWLAIGLVIYFTYGRKRSTLALSHELASAAPRRGAARSTADLTLVIEPAGGDH